MTPKQRYQSLLDSGKYQFDVNQALAIEHLERIYHELKQKQSPKRKFMNLFTQKQSSVKGLYLWGDVGIGKTWLLDIFYDCLLPEQRLRMHFHQFMQQIHLELEQLKGQRDPLKLIVKKISQKTSVLCFDECFVSNIVDAMILAGLLESLFAEDVILLTTSNLTPDDLYKNGLQRQRFLPAISLIKHHCQVLHLATNYDYRLRVLTQASVYYTPIDDKTEIYLQERFKEYAGGHHWHENELLMIAGRSIPTVRYSSDIVWFNFKDLCNIPRSQIDYLEIARTFTTVFLSDVPQIQANQNNMALYLINLVDIFYDNQTKLIISASVPINELYPAGRFSFEFRRTKSRLLEMQSKEYLLKQHLKL